MSDEAPKLCTTSGEPVEVVRANQTEKTGQHQSYIVLCPDERAKGFVRPYRDAYKHVGRTIARCQVTWQGVDDADPHQCIGRADHVLDHEFDALMIFNEPLKDMHGREGGCGSVTTMGRALSETYARDPHFYGATFCVTCNKHYPVAEFVWTADGLQVGS